MLDVISDAQPIVNYTFLQQVNQLCIIFKFASVWKREHVCSYYSLTPYFQAGICFHNISSNTADNVICIYVRVLWSLIYIYNLEHKHWITMSCKKNIVFYIQLYYALVIQYVGSDLSLFCMCACVFIWFCFIIFLLLLFCLFLFLLI